MKILLITMEYPPSRGGVGNYYYNLVKELQNNGFDISILTQSSAAHHQEPISDSQLNSKPEISNQKPSVSVFPFLFKYIRPKWLKLYLEIKKRIKNEKPDIIWVGQVLPVGTVAYLIKKFFGIPYFVSTHGMDIMLPQRSVRKEKLMMKVLNEATFITANSQFTKGQLEKLGVSNEKIEVIYPSCHIDHNRRSVSENQIQLIKKRFNIKERKVLLTVGRLVERKGQDMVIKAMSRILDDFPDLIYLIVGQGPFGGNLKFLISNLKLDDQVKIVEDVIDEELPGYYQLADVFVMPSRDIDGDVEGLGMVYLEAMSFGLPVVAGRSGGVPEVVIDQQTGLLAEPSDISDISQKINELLINQKKGKKLAETGQKIIEKKFNWKIQADKLSEKIKN